MAGNDTTTMLLIAAAGAATGGLALAAAPAALGAGAAAGAATAGTAATTAAGFSTTGALLGAGVGLQAFSQIQSGNAAAQAAKTQQGQAQLQLAADQAAAAVEEENRQRRLRAMLSTQRAIFGSSNIDGQGTGDLIAAKTIGAVNRNTDLASTSANVNTAQSLSSIGQYGRDASASRTSGYTKAAGSLLQFAGQRYDATRTG